MVWCQLHISHEKLIPKIPWSDHQSSKLPFLGKHPHITFSNLLHLYHVIQAMFGYDSAVFRGYVRGLWTNIIPVELIEYNHLERPTLLVATSKFPETVQHCLAAISILRSHITSCGNVPSGLSSVNWLNEEQGETSKPHLCLSLTTFPRFINCRVTWVCKSDHVENDIEVLWGHIHRCTYLAYGSLDSLTYIYIFIILYDIIYDRYIMIHISNHINMNSTINFFNISKLDSELLPEAVATERPGPRTCLRRWHRLPGEPTEVKTSWTNGTFLFLGEEWVQVQMSLFFQIVFFTIFYRYCELIFAQISWIATGIQVEIDFCQWFWCKNQTLCGNLKSVDYSWLVVNLAYKNNVFQIGTYSG